MEKFYKSAPAAALLAEVHGLEELRKTQVISIPQVIELDEGQLVTEKIETTNPSDIFWKNFGKKMAQLHMYQGSEFGFYEDNYIGKSPQKNYPKIHFEAHKDLWPSFFNDYRLKYQWSLAQKKQLATPEFDNHMERLCDQLEKILEGSAEPPCLLHGDLWSGNFICGPNQEPYLIDPAVYYGHREADLAMTYMFGGFSPIFYESYQQVYPLKTGWEKRMLPYQLYHWLNHLNIFGPRYYGQTIQTLKACVGLL